jgi:nucleotide-binding universal stress UspA family protein
MNFKKILCPTDFSEYSYQALDYAKFLAKTFGAKLYVIHVIYEPAEFSAFYVPHVSFDKIKSEIEAGASKLIDEMKEQRLKGEKNVETAVLMGYPSEIIVKFAEDNGIDLIVIGSQGKRGVEKFVFGSTAEKVIRKTSCPVMCIKPKQE